MPSERDTRPETCPNCHNSDRAERHMPEWRKTGDDFWCVHPWHTLPPQAPEPSDAALREQAEVDGMCSSFGLPHEPAVPPVPAEPLTQEEAEGIVQGLREMAAGRTKSIEQIREELMQKSIVSVGISHHTMPGGAPGNHMADTVISADPLCPKCGNPMKEQNTWTDVHHYVCTACHTEKTPLREVPAEPRSAEPMPSLAEILLMQQVRDLRSQLAVAEHWKDDWFTKLSAIEKRAETAEDELAALKSLVVFANNSIGCSDGMPTKVINHLEAALLSAQQENATLSNANSIAIAALEYLAKQGDQYARQESERAKAALGFGKK